LSFIPTFLKGFTMKKTLATLLAAATACTAGILSAPAASAEVTPQECDALRAGLPLIVSITPETTRADLQRQLDEKSNLITEGPLRNLEGIKFLQAKPTADVSGKAQECGIVKPDPVEDFLASIGSSHLAQYLPMVTSLSS